MEFLEKEDFLEKVENFSNKKNVILFIFEEGIYKKEDFDEEMHVGFDLRNKEKTFVRKNETILVKCGVKWAAPLNVFLQIAPRSGLSYKTPLRLANNVGIVEASYRGEIGLLLTTYSFKFQNEVEGIKLENNEIIIEKGTRLAQAIILPSIKHRFLCSEYFEIYYTFDNKLFENWNKVIESKRKERGFGSTGVF